MRPDLTSKQQRFLGYLEREIRRTGKTPSLRQAAAEMGVSHAAISQFVKALEKKGLIRRDGRYWLAYAATNTSDSSTEEPFRVQRAGMAVSDDQDDASERISDPVPVYGDETGVHECS